MSSSDSSILLIGESGVGKTHYGAQLLKRLMAGSGQLRMHGAATNLEPFQAALESLNEGLAADHTPTSTYVDSIWPIVDSHGKTADLIWPDYGGEQIKAISTTRRIPANWRDRVIAAPAWLLLIRLQQIHTTDDVFSRPLDSLQNTNIESRTDQVSDQARLIELLQILIYLRGSSSDVPLETPRLAILLTCWDELGTNDKPADVLHRRLPMLSAFIASTWLNLAILGLSALERPLRPRDKDAEYAARGPEQFGYVVLPEGERTSDLTFPIKLLLADHS